jgi:uncharacterized protein YPO0396
MKRMTGIVSMIVGAMSLAGAMPKKSRHWKRKPERQETHLAELAGRISALQKEQSALKERLSILSKLGEYTDFRELDWKPVAVAIARLEAEKRDLKRPPICSRP